MRVATHVETPVHPDAAFGALLDPRQVAACVPGLALTHAESGRWDYAVTLNVRRLVTRQQGTIEFRQVDRAARTAAIFISGSSGGTADVRVSVSGDRSDRCRIDLDVQLHLDRPLAELDSRAVQVAAHRLTLQVADNLVALNGVARSATVRPAETSTVADAHPLEAGHREVGARSLTTSMLVAAAVALLIWRWRGRATDLGRLFGGRG